jgi:hypothetical protein
LESRHIERVAEEDGFVAKARDDIKEIPLVAGRQAIIIHLGF